MSSADPRRLVGAASQRSFRTLIALLAALALLAACGSSDATSESDEAASDTGETGSGDQPTIVVTTNILGDVVAHLVGDQAEVVAIMPVGADPHDFQASAQEVAAMQEADALIHNGADFEENLLDVIENAEADGVAAFAAISAVETIEYGEGDAHDHAEDEEHGEEEDHDHEEEGHEHSHEGVDPHFFTDPARMAVAAAAIGDFLATVDGIDAAALGESVDAYVAELESLDAEVEETLSVIPDDGRILITNHEVFGYFADRYDFEVVGTVIPTGSTADGASAEALAELAEEIEHEGVPAIFADTSSSSDLADTLAAEVGDVEVIALFSESLGEEGSGGATYVEMVRSNAESIVSGLG